MGELREQRDMRKATRLMWLSIALSVLTLGLTWNHYRYGGIGILFILSLPLLPTLFSAAFFCLYQRGFRLGQMLLLLPVCAVVLNQLYLNGRYLTYGFSVTAILAVLGTLSEIAFLLALLVGLKKDDRRALRFAKNLVIASAIIWTIWWIVYVGIRIATNEYWFFSFTEWLEDFLTDACKMVIYALIAYRGVVVDDIALPGYPMRAAKPADPALRAASNSTVQGGQVVMGTKSKVAAALLAFFLGTTGAHRYYLGYKKQGIIQTCGFVSLILGWMLYFPAMMNGGAGMLLVAGLLLLYGSVVGIWAFVDFIRILIGSLAPADGSGYAAQQAQAVQPAPAPSSGLDDLEKLAKLRDSGVLTEEEFQQKKAEILARL